MDAALLHLDAHLMAQVVVETAQNIVAPVYEGHARAEPGEDAGELDGDVADPLNKDAMGKFRKVDDTSFEEITCSMPGMDGPRLGDDPVAIRICAARLNRPSQRDGAYARLRTPRGS